MLCVCVCVCMDEEDKRVGGGEREREREREREEPLSVLISRPDLPPRPLPPSFPSFFFLNFFFKLEGDTPPHSPLPVLHMTARRPHEAVNLVRASTRSCQAARRGRCTLSR